MGKSGKLARQRYWRQRGADGGGIGDSGADEKGQTAHGQSSAAHDATHHDTTTTPSLSPLFRAYRPPMPEPRDPLTGVSLADAKRAGVQFFLRWRDYDAARDANERQPIPYSIHAGGIDRRGGEIRAARSDYAGGLAFSPAFVRYAGKVVPTTVRHDQTLCTQWWKVPMVRDRIVAHFTSARDQRILAAILEMRCAGREMADACSARGMTINEVIRRERHFAAYAKRTYQMPGDVPPEVQTWHAGDGGVSLVSSLFGDGNLAMTAGEVAG